MVASKFSSKSDLNFTRIPIAFYENVWKKSNILYITYIVVGCVLIEVVYGSVTTAVWDGYNQGVRIRLL
jgi:Ubiquinol-cytochrome C reductase, UQCRX/QCR9 like